MKQSSSNVQMRLMHVLELMVQMNVHAKRVIKALHAGVSQIFLVLFIYIIISTGYGYGFFRRGRERVCLDCWQSQNRFWRLTFIKKSFLPLRYCVSTIVRSFTIKFSFSSIFVFNFGMWESTKFDLLKAKQFFVPKCNKAFVVCYNHSPFPWKSFR